MPVENNSSYRAKSRYFVSAHPPTSGVISPSSSTQRFCELEATITFYKTFVVPNVSETEVNRSQSPGRRGRVGKDFKKCLLSALKDCFRATGTNAIGAPSSARRYQTGLW